MHRVNKKYGVWWMRNRVNSRASTIHSMYKWPSLRINSLSETIIFADDTSVIISSKSLDNFCTVSILLLSYVSQWFAANDLLLNLDQINIITIRRNNFPRCALSSPIDCKGKCTEGTVSTKFFGLWIYNWLNRKILIDNMIPK
jgi:hypothetical protein